MPKEHPTVPAARTSASLAVEVMNILKGPTLNAFVEGTEILLDMSVDEGVLRDIPIVGQIAGLGRSLMSVPDRLFVRKLRRFVGALDGVPEIEKKAFLEKMEREGLYEKVGEKVLMIVDQIDDVEKASLAGYAFRAYVTGSIDKDHFEILCSCIALTRITDMKAFLLHRERLNALDPQVCRALAHAGLVDWDINIGETSLDSASVRGSIFYSPSSYGLLLARILQDRRQGLEEEAASAQA